MTVAGLGQPSLAACCRTPTRRCDYDADFQTAAAVLAMAYPWASGKKVAGRLGIAAAGTNSAAHGCPQRRSLNPPVGTQVLQLRRNP